MKILGIETSCDECSMAVVEDGTSIVSQIIATQIEQHAPYSGVVPEIASRTHTEWIAGVYSAVINDVPGGADALDAIAVTVRPGLSGSLVVGLSFAKGLALGLDLPMVGVDHVLAHLYAPQLENTVEYPFLGLIVSGGHTIISRVDGPLTMTVMGTTIDDACGEAFDKVAKHLGLAYPGGVAIDRLSREGDATAFDFPDATLNKGEHPYDVSYSGLKTAVVNQLEQFRNPGCEATPADIAASFQRAAIDLVLKRLYRAIEDTGLTTVVVGGGVAANSLLRSRLEGDAAVRAVFPSVALCTDNGAMVAGLGFHLLQAGFVDDLDLDVSARVQGFRKTYP